MKKLLILLALAGTFIFVYFTWMSKSVPPASSASKIKSSKLREISGLVFSEQNEGLMWMHNDSGRGKRFYLVDKSGVTRAVFTWDEDLKDWEDIALGPGPVKGKPYIYAGDIGDNTAVRPDITIYRFPEPKISDEKHVTKVEKIIYKYPDRSRDAEAMFIDPLTEQLYIISKREANVRIYKASTHYRDGDTAILERVGKLHIEGLKMLGWVTAADISRDGEKILVRTYGNVFYWKRRPDQTVEEALKAQPQKLTHVGELQGEAIGFTPDGKGYYTVREGKNPYLNYNRIKK